MTGQDEEGPDCSDRCHLSVRVDGVFAGDNGPQGSGTAGPFTPGSGGSGSGLIQVTATAPTGSGIGWYLPGSNGYPLHVTSIEVLGKNGHCVYQDEEHPCIPETDCLVSSVELVCPAADAHKKIRANGQLMQTGTVPNSQPPQGYYDFYIGKEPHCGEAPIVVVITSDGVPGSITITIKCTMCEGVDDSWN